MIKYILKLFTIFLITIILISCSGNLTDTNPGTGAETTNGFVVSSVGTPIANAKVYVIDRSKWHENYKDSQKFVFYETTTDSNGSFNLKKNEDDTLPKHFNIQIDYENEGIVIEDTLVMDGDTLKLNKHGTFVGSIIDSSLNSHSLFLAGTNYKTTIKSNGHFEFNQISAGTYPVFADPDSLLMVRVLKLSTDSTVRDNNIPVLSHSLLVEDFQTGEFNFTVLGKSTGAEWYTYNDNDTNTNTPYFNSILTNSVKLLSDGEYALHYETVLRADYNQAKYLEHPYTGIGFPLGESYVDKDTSFELSNMDSLTFKAKGYGIVRIKIGDLITDSIFGGEWNDFGYYLELEDSENWKRYSITPEMLKLASIDSTKPGYDLKWEDVADYIYRIEFEFNGSRNDTDETLDLWLDDIVIHGINLEQLIKYRKSLNN